MAISSHLVIATGGAAGATVKTGFLENGSYRYSVGNGGLSGIVRRRTAISATGTPGGQSYFGNISANGGGFGFAEPYDMKPGDGGSGTTIGGTGRSERFDVDDHLIVGHRYGVAGTNGPINGSTYGGSQSLTAIGTDSTSAYLPTIEQSPSGSAYGGYVLVEYLGPLGDSTGQ